MNKNHGLLFSLLLFPLLLLTSCGEIGKDKFEIAIRTSALTDSSCGGGRYAQTFRIKNISKKDREILPVCRANSPGVRVHKAPDEPIVLKPGQTKGFSCYLEDVDNPPDGNKTNSKVTFAVYVDGQKATAEVPVTCEDG